MDNIEHCAEELFSEGIRVPGVAVLRRRTNLLPQALRKHVADFMEGDSLKSKSLKGSAWTVIGHGVSQLLRLASNLVLTRLLVPEAFGLMALVSVFMQGLAMFSEIGIGPSIIHNKRGDDTDFLNTAWTLQVIRGFLLWLGACALAWPASSFYAEPFLFQLLPAAGLSAIISGFIPTKRFTANRHLALGRLTLVELANQLTSLLILLILAWSLRSVWALVIGGLAGSAVQVMLTRRMLPGPNNRFRLDPTAMGDLVRFGRWIFWSTIFLFVFLHGDRVVLGKMMTSTELGIYTVAFTMSQVLKTLSITINSKVLFPAYARLTSADDIIANTRLFQNVFRARMLLMLAFIPVSVLMAIFGDTLINLLYDARYQAAGPMLQILSVGSIGAIVCSSSAVPAMMAKGDSFGVMLQQAIRGIIFIGAMSIGGWLDGSRGIVMGVATSMWVEYLPTIWAARRAGVWMPALDVTVLLTSAALVACGWCLFGIQS